MNLHLACSMKIYQKEAIKSRKTERMLGAEENLKEMIFKFSEKLPLLDKMESAHSTLPLLLITVKSLWMKYTRQLSEDGEKERKEGRLGTTESEKSPVWDADFFFLFVACLLYVQWAQTTTKQKQKPQGKPIFSSVKGLGKGWLCRMQPI